MNQAVNPASDTIRSANDATLAPSAVPHRPVITVASIIERDRRFLVIEEETHSGVRLNQPAGHVEVGESIAQAAARETLEEAAWHVNPIALVGVYHWQSPRNGTYVRFTFAAKPRAHERTRPLDTGIVRALWLTYDEIAARRQMHRSPLVLRSLDDYRAGRRWPLGLIASL
ncbi:MAG TPA: NUDIX hydrolase [Casimicrobiaceae bacterium]|nr:NUDIX hydrolase [Casimicrobiaceae bacterium]